MSENVLERVDDDQHDPRPDPGFYWIKKHFTWTVAEFADYGKHGRCWLIYDEDQKLDHLQFIKAGYQLGDGIPPPPNHP